VSGAAATTIAVVRREIARRLLQTSPTAALDARILVAHVMGLPSTQLTLHDDEPMSPELAERAYALGDIRASGVPVARIVGEKEFFGMRFGLSPETLIPRPDTETLVETALAAIVEDWNRLATITILDLGTGTGAILLALLSRLPNATGLGVDRAPGAVAMARENARYLGLDDRSDFVEGNWTDGIRDRFNVVVSNPPYIRSGDIPGLQVEVRDHDPHLALDGGADGFDAIDTILGDLGRVLAPNGIAFFEMGAGQGRPLLEMAAIRGFDGHLVADIAGIDRVAVLRRIGDV